MFRVSAPARSAIALRRTPSKGEAFASRDRLLPDDLRTRPAGSAFAARIEAQLVNTQKLSPFIFSNSRTPFPTLNPQPSHCHAFADSFAQDKKVTLAFPVTSGLFARSFAQERKLTDSFSIACALFCRKWGWRRNSVHICTIVTTTMTLPLAKAVSRGTFSTGLVHRLALPRQPDLVYKLCQPNL
jgi:hypothetical protein